jgi:hypothetical protein
MKEQEPVKNQNGFDNTEFLGYENDRIFIFDFRYGDWHECSQGEIAYIVNPTHWMPLPEPPK